MTDAIEQVEPDVSDPNDTEKEPASSVVDEDLKERVRQLEESVASRDNELIALKGALVNAVDKYRTAVLATAPGVPEELLRGETVEDIDASLEQARRIVLQVKQQLDNDVATRNVPAGAPPRTPPDMSSLSPTEKIAHALITERR